MMLWYQEIVVYYMPATVLHSGFVNCNKFIHEIFADLYVVSFISVYWAVFFTSQCHFMTLTFMSCSSDWLLVSCAFWSALFHILLLLQVVNSTVSTVTTICDLDLWS